MEWFSGHNIQHLIATYGYWPVGVVIGLECMGLPLPGETILLIAALYASRHPELSIWGVIAAAATGAIIGDNVGYGIGRTFGYPLLLRFGPRLGLTDAKIKLGQYLFIRHGAKVVFFARFIAILRVLAALLAGVNRMPWPRFLVANAAGGIVWAALYGGAAYSFGSAILRAHGPVAIALICGAIIAIVLSIRYLRSHEAYLQSQAEQALPGPLRMME